MILTLNRVTKTTPQGKTLLKDVSLGMYLGAKIGILGANGAGKSTLMRILAGVDQNFDGTVQLESGVRIGYLEQEPRLDAGKTVRENIEPAVERVKSMIREFEEVSGARRVGQVSGPRWRVLYWLLTCPSRPAQSRWRTRTRT